MSHIGQLEQLNLPLVLRGIETYAKTGLLVVKKEGRWVELYFRDGRLMCIGPARPNSTLSDRLLQAGVISAKALQDTLTAVGDVQPGETRMALTLMDLGHMSHESLRAWATEEAREVIKVLLTWQSGEIYFEDGTQPPADRLLVALSPATLLSPPPTAAPAQRQRDEGIEAPLQSTKEKHEVKASAQPASLLSAAQLVTEPPPVVPSPPSPVPSFSTVNIFSDTNAHALPLTPPVRVDQPLPPMRIDTSFMRPEMVLIPLDLSALRGRNPQLQITPEQWRVLTRVDGRTSLQAACQELGVPADLLCQVAGELIALGLVQVTIPPSPVNKFTPAFMAPGSNNGYPFQGYVPQAQQPPVTVTPTTEALPPTFGSSVPFETMSQWGNGGNGATFVPGRGWVANPQPLQPLQSAPPTNATSGAYAPVGSGR